MSHANRRVFLVVLVSLFLTCALVAQGGSGSKGGGRLEIKGIKGSDAVYLNGIGPQFLVGTVEETRSKDLILPPGQQHVILVDPNGNKQVYSTYVIIKPGQKATLHVDKSDTYYESWAGDPGLQIMGVGNAPIAPVTGTFVAQNLVPCGQKARLTWTTTGYNTMLKALVNTNVAYGGLGVSGGEMAVSSADPVAPVQADQKVAYSGLAGSGELMVDPGEGTTYVLESFGPGGVFISPPQTVRVNKEVHATLTASPTVMRYHQVGDKVIEDPMITLNWTADNADKVNIDPIGPVSGTSGQQLVKFKPSKSDFGPIDELRMYKLTATNPCGGANTTTASVQVAGSIDPEIVAENLPPVLPKTGSPLPLIALLGFGSVVSGLCLRMFRKR
jgi:LPXTG-motif cell wall-anchored protein